MNRLSDRLVLALVLTALAACADTRRGADEDLDQIAARHTHEMDTLRTARADFERRNPMPMQLEFVGAGTVLVHEAKLLGLLGNEVLRVQYTWVNTTANKLDAVHVRIALHSAAVGDGNTDEADLRPPFRMTFVPDCSYTTYAEVPTLGLHAHADWTWKLEVTAKTHVERDATGR